MGDERLLLTVREASRLLGLSERRLYALIEERALPAGVVVRLGRAIRLSRPRLRRWLGVDGTDESVAEDDQATATTAQALRRSARDVAD